jgi:hypothetical protein
MLFEYDNIYAVTFIHIQMNKKKSLKNIFKDKAGEKMFIRPSDVNNPNVA